MMGNGSTGSVPQVHFQWNRWLFIPVMSAILSLADINYIDSSGVGERVTAFASVRNQGGEWKLLHLTKKVHDVLQTTKLYTVFDVKDKEAAAISAF